MFLEGSAIEDENKNIFYVIFYNDIDDEIYVKPKYLYKSSKYYKISENKSPYLLQKYLKYNIYKYSNYLKKYTYIFPIEHISKYYNPIAKCLQILDRPTNIYEKVARNIILEIIKESNEKAQNFGISGSILVNLQNEKSDIDIFYYGNNYKAIYDSLVRLFRKRKFSPFKGNLLKNLYIERNFRKIIDYKIFKKLKKIKKWKEYMIKNFHFR
jgi:Uncharacterized protein conserved in archaea